MRRHLIIIIDRGVVEVHLQEPYKNKESEIAQQLKDVGYLPPPAVGAVIVFFDNEGKVDDFLALGDPYLEAFLKANYEGIKKIIEGIFDDQTILN